MIEVKRLRGVYLVIYKLVVEINSMNRPATHREIAELMRERNKPLWKSQDSSSLKRRTRELVETGFLRRASDLGLGSEGFMCVAWASPRRDLVKQKTLTELMI